MGNERGSAGIVGVAHLDAPVYETVPFLFSSICPAAVAAEQCGRAAHGVHYLRAAAAFYAAPAKAQGVSAMVTKAGMAKPITARFLPCGWRRGAAKGGR